MNRLFVLLLLITLGGCGSGAGSSTLDSPATASDNSQLLDGIWNGQITIDQEIEDQEVIGLSLRNGSFLLASLTTGSQMKGNLIATGDQLNGNGILIAPAGAVWMDSSSLITTSLSGQISERALISANWTSPSGNTGGINLQYDQEAHGRSSNTVKLSGKWSLWQRDYIVGELDFIEGEVLGLDLNGCAYSGEFYPISDGFNGYDVRLNIQRCPDSIDGTYSGMAFFTDITLPNGQINRDAQLIISIADEGNYFLRTAKLDRRK